MSPGEEDRVVVWRVGDALLAAPLADTTLAGLILLDDDRIAALLAIDALAES